MFFATVSASNFSSMKGTVFSTSSFKIESTSPCPFLKKQKLWNLFIRPEFCWNVYSSLLTFLWKEMNFKMLLFVLPFSLSLQNCKNVEHKLMKLGWRQDPPGPPNLKFSNYTAQLNSVCFELVSNYIFSMIFELFSLSCFVFYAIRTVINFIFFSKNRNFFPKKPEVWFIFL